MLTAEELPDIQSATAEQVLEWGLATFHPRIALASSFSIEDVVVIDMLSRLRADARVFTLDTGRLHEETYEVMEAIRRRYGVTIETHFPERQAVERLERIKGLYSFRRSIEDRKECCNIRKVTPLKRALSGLDAWTTGLRREQAVTRGDLPKIDWSDPHKVKLNPLADWSLKRVWAYVRENDIPYNKLYDRRFPSIGCAPCTRAVQPGEDLRAGRWWWERPEEKECGLHPGRNGSNGNGGPPREVNPPSN